MKKNDPNRVRIEDAIKARIRQMRLAKLLTIDRTAKLVGMTARAYINYEQGLRTPSGAHLVRLAEVLGATVGQVAGAEDIDDWLLFQEPNVEHDIGGES